MARMRFLLFLFVVPLFAGSDPVAPHVRNFDRVNEHLFRGGEPTAAGLEELAAMGVKIDIDLRGSGEGVDTERHEAEKLGMKYVNVPMSGFGAPSNEQMDRVLSLLLQNESLTTFVHCRRGKDRTGTVVACYRVAHDTWPNERALKEAKQHGMSFTERAMQSYIIHFTPRPLSALAKPRN